MNPQLLFKVSDRFGDLILRRTGRNLGETFMECTTESCVFCTCVGIQLGEWAKRFPGGFLPSSLGCPHTPRRVREPQVLNFSCSSLVTRGGLERRSWRARSPEPRCGRWTQRNRREWKVERFGRTEEDSRRSNRDLVFSFRGEQWWQQMGETPGGNG